MIFALLLIVGGLLLLVGGAHGLVKGCAALALKFSISPLVIGLTIIAFGTSSPELLVSLNAASIGEGHLAIGNVVGSNIANIALILGMAAAITPLSIKAKVVRVDLPIVIASTLLILILLADGSLSRLDGAILSLLIVGYLGFSYVMARREKVELSHPNVGEHGWIASMLMIAGGSVVLILGAHLMVQGALEIAERLLISTAFVGLTIVAFGTSLPELATSLIAAFHKQVDMAIGNVLGSNIFNILGILGPTALIFPIEDFGIGWPSLWVMTGVALLALPLLKSGFTLSRREGAFLLLIYAGYIGYLLVNVTSP